MKGTLTQTWNQLCQRGTCVASSEGRIGFLGMGNVWFFSAGTETDGALVAKVSLVFLENPRDAPEYQEEE